MGVEARGLRSVFGIFEISKARAAVLLTVGALGLGACGGGQESSGSEAPVGSAGAPLDGEIAPPSDEEGEYIPGLEVDTEEEAMKRCLYDKAQAAAEDPTVHSANISYNDQSGERRSVSC